MSHYPFTTFHSPSPHDAFPRQIPYIGANKNEHAMYVFSRLTVAFIVFLVPFISSATIRLPYFFSDGMVLKQNSDAAIWGWASPGTTVKVNTS